MTKIMLVEDDKSLREIYGIRLVAEGYEIVSAGDGEEALAMAIKEHPDLILADVMMPKISGFDMLDILRATPETKDVKVVMMTALSSEDQRARGESLGANRYLVKSQVGIEDVVRTIHDVLSDSATVTTPVTNPELTTVPAPQPVATPTPTPSAEPILVPSEPVAPVQLQAVTKPEPLQAPETVITPDFKPVHAPVTQSDHTDPSVFNNRTMDPVGMPSQTPDIVQMADNEPKPVPVPPVPPAPAI